MFTHILPVGISPSVFSHHGMCLARPGLPVSKHCAVVAIEDFLYKRTHYFLVYCQLETKEKFSINICTGCFQEFVQKIKIKFVM